MGHSCACSALTQGMQSMRFQANHLTDFVIVPSGNPRINLRRFIIMRYPNAAKGIKKTWIAEILGILAANQKAAPRGKDLR